MKPSSLRSLWVTRFLRMMIKPLLDPRFSLKWQRLVVALLKFLPPPRGVKRQQWAGNGLPGFKLIPVSSSRENAAILFFHGGGFGTGSPGTHLALTMHIARATGLKVYTPSYRLAPESPFPAQLEDAEAALAALLRDENGLENLFLAGDSAGGNLALAITQRLLARGSPSLRGLILISPWADISLSNLSENENDALLSLAWLRQMRDAFVPKRLWHTSEVSPIRSNFANFPPTLIQAASSELFLRDIVQLHEIMLAAGVEAELQLAPGLWHDYQMFAGQVPEADAAVEKIAHFIKRVCSSNAAGSSCQPEVPHLNGPSSMTSARRPSISPSISEYQEIT